MKNLRKYPLTYDPIREYWQEIQAGREIVSRKVYKTYKHLVWKLDHPGEFFYSPARANHVIEFFENYCHHSKGKMGGKLVKLELWEKALLAAVFGFIDLEGNRQYRKCGLIVGKKNGKSLLASGVGLYMQLADGEPGPEVYAVATKRDQAKVIWSEAKRMVRKSSALLKRVRPLVAELCSDFNDGVFKPLASDADSLDGLNIHCALMDELHQWKNGRALYDIVADGMIAREQPLLFITSTAGVIREDIYDDCYEDAEKIINGYDDPDGYQDERTLYLVYELDSRAEWTDPKCWKKANPGLGTIKNYRALAEKVRKAMQNPALVKNLVCKEFNIRETSSEAWLTFEELDNRDTFQLDPVAKRFIWRHKEGEDWQEVELPYPKYGIGGADLSSTTDLTAAKVLFMVPGCPKIFALSMCWLPEELLDRRAKEDNIPYDRWLERDLLRLSPGNKVHYKHVKDWFVEVQEKLDIYVTYVGYDSWSATYWVEDMKSYFGDSAMIAVHQGKKTLSDPMKRLKNDLGSKVIVYNNNPIDKWCLANTSYEEDKNGNIQPHKTSKPTRRIDCTAALLDAYTILQDKQEEYESMIA
ncbi:MAG: terminase large subunit [Oscillospiraceae bacterium]|nr:terminase large subunit [Oscillospiraceae bacterium]MBR2422024.1 terminase large subunit [Oscillospiraceae bacterium]